ncbi:MAG: hypothetical protein Ta2E_12650 [Mycoplasmoidaceae bacterium]|nr:MAG: hypothetical protein Ta2E_12650 [Mycoplasmoidaceae bacterium]
MLGKLHMDEITYCTLLDIMKQIRFSNYAEPLSKELKCIKHSIMRYLVLVNRFSWKWLGDAILQRFSKSIHN